MEILLSSAAFGFHKKQTCRGFGVTANFSPVAPLRHDDGSAMIRSKPWAIPMSFRYPNRRSNGLQSPRDPSLTPEACGTLSCRSHSRSCRSGQDNWPYIAYDDRYIVCRRLTPLVQRGGPILLSAAR